MVINLCVCVCLCVFCCCCCYCSTHTSRTSHCQWLERLVELDCDAVEECAFLSAKNRSEAAQSASAARVFFNLSDRHHRHHLSISHVDTFYYLFSLYPERQPAAICE